jgi:hypothetical protein
MKQLSLLDYSISEAMLVVVSVWIGGLRKYCCNFNTLRIHYLISVLSVIRNVSMKKIRRFIGKVDV